jgi:hypothetical protein
MSLSCAAQGVEISALTTIDGAYRHLRLKSLDTKKKSMGPVFDHWLCRLSRSDFTADALLAVVRPRSFDVF